jgi:hypothetical protein
MSTKWSEGPGASITNFVKDYLGNELMEIVLPLVVMTVLGMP